LSDHVVMVITFRKKKKQIREEPSTYGTPVQGENHAVGRTEEKKKSTFSTPPGERKKKKEKARVDKTKKKKKKKG